ncbi:hypothetical protein ASG37_08125 [Sphingomonas sp. Leaf407]|uniref:RHS repeat protein n=1 Tax=unclassified Sphingomonas TaxID=196159 RepID=UPI0006F56E3F|nr:MULTISPECIES: RHS repeat protein [unclassified Sphingomonas]KQN39513.1 hypothetical protein ASE97_05415 [Sphingomonas sp. Leaf42]KQT28790.1 hypothetical protein ASG37_08125 [Sphingomonas sp. Leaf407]
MVAIFTGAGTGFERGSGNVLGAGGTAGNAGTGRNGEQVMLNAANGNLVVSQRDEFLVGRGPDAAILRTYNSHGDWVDDNSDNWRMSNQRRIHTLTGSVNTAGSTVKRTGADGSVTTFTWSTAESAYVSTEGSGAFDQIRFDQQWRWTDGDTRIVETYAGPDNQISEIADPSGNRITFSYSGLKLTRTRTEDGGTIDYEWSGNNIVKITTGYRDVATGLTASAVRTRYGYDSLNRLQTVEVDLSPDDKLTGDGNTYVTTYAYHGNTRNLAAITQSDGLWTAFDYDAASRVNRITQAVTGTTNRVTTIAYDSGATTVTDPAGQATKFEYNADGSLRTLIAPPASAGEAQQITRFSYTASGDVASVTDPAGRTTRHVYDTRGNAVATLEPDGGVVVRTFNADNQVLTEARDANRVPNAAVSFSSEGWYYPYDPHKIANGPIQTGNWQNKNFIRGHYKATAAGQVISIGSSNFAVQGGERLFVGTGLEAWTPISSQTLKVWWSDSSGAVIGGTDIASVNGPQYYDTKVSAFIDVPANAVKGRIELYGWSAGAGDGHMLLVEPTVVRVPVGTTQAPAFGAYAADSGPSVNRYVYDSAKRLAYVIDGEGGVTEHVYNGFGQVGWTATMTNKWVDNGWFGPTGTPSLTDMQNWMNAQDRSGAMVVAYTYDAQGNLNSEVRYGTTGSNGYGSGADGYSYTTFQYDRAGQLIGRVNGRGWLQEAQEGRLGRFLQEAGIRTGGQTLSKRYTLNPASARTAIDADLIKLDSWDGEQMTVYLNGTAAFSFVPETALGTGVDALSGQLSVGGVTGTWSITSPGQDLHVAGAGNFSDRVYRLHLDLRGAGAAITLGLGATLDQERADESFGIDNIVVTQDGAFDDFENGSPAGWTLNGSPAPILPVQRGQSSGMSASLGLIGGSGGAEALSKTYGLNAGQPKANVDFDFTKTDSWDGEKLSVFLNGTRMFDFVPRAYWGPGANMANGSFDVGGLRGTYRITPLGEERFVTTAPDWEELSYHVQIEVEGTGGSLRVGFGATLDEAVSNEAYTIDSVRVGQPAQVDTFTGDSLSGWGSPSGAPILVGSGAGDPTVLPAQESFVYDGLGRLIASTDASGATTRIVFDDRNSRTIMAVATGLTTVSTYNRAGELIASNRSGSFMTSGAETFVYDTLGRPRMRVDASGNASYWLYDAAGRKVADIGHGGQMTEYRYNIAGQLTATIQHAFTVGANHLNTLASGAAIDVGTLRPDHHSQDVIVWNVYDSTGRLTGRVDGAGTVVEYGYAANQQIAWTRAYRNRLSVDTVWPFRNNPPTGLVRPPVSATDSVSRNFYNRAGRLIGALDGEGYLTRYEYDAAGRKTRELRPSKVTAANLRQSGSYAELAASVGPDGLDHDERYIYDNQGLLRFRTDGAGRLTEYRYDSGQSVTSPSGPVQTIVYERSVGALNAYDFVTVRDAIAQQGLGTLPGNRTSHAVYDRAGRLAYTIDADGTVAGIGYDAAGQQVRSTVYAQRRPTGSLPSKAEMDQWARGNANGGDRTVRTLRNAAGQVRFTVDGEGYVTGNDYDADGRVLRTMRWDTQVSIDDAATVATLAATLGNPATANHFVYDALGRLVEQADGEGNRTRRFYGATGVLQYEITPFASAGQVTTWYDYDGAGRVRQRIDAAGSSDAATTQFEYDGLGNLTAETDPLGRTTRHEYDRAGRRTATVDALNGRSVFEYDAFDNVVRATDARGNATLRYYDKLDRVVAVRDAENYVTETSYTAFGEIAQVTRRASRATNAASPADRPTVASDARDATTRFRYDKRGQVIVTTDAEGFSEHRWYDGFGNVVQVQNKVGGIVRRSYDRRGLMVGETTAHGSSAPDGTRHAADVSIAELDVAFYRTTYPDLAGVDDNGLRAHWTNHGWKEGRRPNAFFDPAYYLSTYSDVAAAQIDPLKHYREYGMAYEARRGAAAASTMPLQSTGGTVSWLQYDARGNLTRRIEAAGLPEQRFTTLVYDKADRLIETRGDTFSTVDPTTYHFQPATAPVERTIYDRRGNAIERIDARGGRTLAWYDALNRKIAEANPVGTLSTWTYDKMGNVMSAKVYEKPIALPADARGVPPTPVSGSDVRETRFEYDPLNRLQWQEMVGVRWGAGGPGAYQTAIGNLRTTYVYDANGNVLSSTDGAGITLHSTYDRANRKLRQADGERFVTEWQYDAESNVVQERRYATAATQVAPGVITPAAQSGDDRVTSFIYDRNGRRTKETRHGVVAYATNGNGGIVEVSARDQSIRYDYTALGQVYAKTEATGEETRYAHDMSGRLRYESRAAYADATGQTVNPAVSYFYDAVGNLVRTEQHGSAGISARVTTYAYGPGSLLSSMTDAAGATTSYYYNVAGDLLRQAYTRTTIDAAGSSDKAEGIFYTRDILGRVTSEAKGSWDGTQWARGDTVRSRYNGFGEVAARGVGTAASTKFQESFRYDGAGRLAASNTGDGVWRYYVYDAAGRQTLTIANLTREDLLDKTQDQAMEVARGGSSTIGAQNVGGLHLTFQFHDARGLLLGSSEPFAQTGGATSGRSRSLGYTAFGEVAFETDFLGNRTDYGYNTMGRVATVRRAQVEAYGEDGTMALVRPQERNFHDRSGRLIGSEDALGRWQSRELLAGTGYAGSEAIATRTWANGPGRGVLVQRYDGFGDLRKSIDELNNETAMDYDAMGRLTAVYRPGNIREYYRYDQLGQRIKHWNVGYGEDKAALTQYDMQGRTIWTRAIGGAGADTVSTTRAWADSIGLSHFAQQGGWAETATYANGKTTITRTDRFDRTLETVDMGGGANLYGYDYGGRLTSELRKASSSGAVLRETIYETLNTGVVSRVLRQEVNIYGDRSDSMETTAGYDLNGRKTSEKSWRWEAGTKIQTQNATSAYDALGRRTSWIEAGSGRDAPAASITHRYDAVGNIRSTKTASKGLNDQGNEYASFETNEWFRYDHRNRVVHSSKRNPDGTTIQGKSVDTLYNDAGQRVTATYAIWLPATVNNPWDYDDRQSSIETSFEGKRREDYTYTAQGTLSEVRIAESGYSDNGDGTATGIDPTAPGRLTARYTYDALGRMRRQIEWSGDGSQVIHDRQTHYDAFGRFAWESSVTRDVSNVIRRTNSFNSYTRGSEYALGTVLTQLVKTYTIASNTANASSSEITEEGKFEYEATTQSYVGWYGGAVTTSTVTKQKDKTDRTSSYGYDVSGTLTSVAITDARSRTVSYRNDLAGQVLERREQDGNTGKGDPRAVTYRFDGQQQLEIGNDGTDAVDYQTSLDRRRSPKGRQNKCGGLGVVLVAITAPQSLTG